MNKSPPPIQWLPVFEASARLLSFKRAAEELCVTPPAVSQQIKILEAYLGVVLFDRSGRKLRLTAPGEHYFGIASAVLNRHQEGYREFERRFHQALLQISAPIFIAQELLIPNFSDFKNHAPEAELRILTGNDLVDFDTTPVDAAIRFGDGEWPDLNKRLLSEVTLSLVSSDAYLHKQGLDRDSYFDAQRVQDQVLISLYEDIRDWTTLFPEIEPQRTIVCDSYFAASRLAEEGQGIMVGLLPIIKRLIKSGRLCPLLGPPLETNYSYWLVTPKRKSGDPNVDAFFRWSKQLFESL